MDSDHLQSRGTFKSKNLTNNDNDNNSDFLPRISTIDIPDSYDSNSLFVRGFDNPILLPISINSGAVESYNASK